MHAGCTQRRCSCQSLLHRVDHCSIVILSRLRLVCTLWVNITVCFSTFCNQQYRLSVMEGHLSTRRTPPSISGHHGDNNCEMQYTSDTSGRPKGVMLPHNIVVQHALGCMIQHRITSNDMWRHIAPVFSVTWVSDTATSLRIGETHRKRAVLETW